MLPIICKTSIVIEPATLADLPAIDALQKQFGKALGYFPTAQLRGYIEMGGVLVARAKDEGGRMKDEPDASSSSFSLPPSSFLLGYILWRDRYLKRDELGVIYQLCVAPSAHRKLIGASLVKAAFERSAYGCRLFCLWCAQDLEANRFWESLGFVPIAFRAGGANRGKRRVHIFWQRRVRADDVVTPYWFPSRTSNGAIREDRLVLPIPMGVHWSDEMPILLPQEQAPPPALPQQETGKARKQRSGKIAPVQEVSRYAISRSTLYFAPKPGEKPKPERKRPAAVQTNPRLLAMARELRDRWLERMNSGEFALADGRYDVARIGQANRDQGEPARALPLGQPRAYPMLLPAA